MEPGENPRTTGVSYWKNSAHAALAPACAIPNATALAASFDPDLLHQAGSFLALETKARNAVCLLAPTVNIQRSPLGGRSFESFSETRHFQVILRLHSSMVCSLEVYPRQSNIS